MKTAFSRFVLIGISLASAMLAAAQSLTIGTPAPKVKVAEWVKGSKVDEFKPGNIYVVEFWATWCGPCKVSIPHLTELAHKYQGEVNFCGVSVFETPVKGASYNTTLPGVKQFVQDMGDKMDYNVAADDNNKFMADHWMKAAGMNVIPTAFIIDKQGEVAWIGHPNDMAIPLGQVVDGTWDIKAAAAARKEEMEKQAVAAKAQAAAQAKDKAEYEAWQKTPLGMKMTEASADLKAKKYEETLKLADEIAVMPSDNRVEDPALAAAEYGMNAYNGMHDMDGFYKSCEKAFDRMDAKAKELEAAGKKAYDEKGQPVELYWVTFNMNNGLSWPVADPDSKLARKDYDFAIKVAERVAQITERKDPNWLDTLAWAYYGKGDHDKAASIETEAINLCKGHPDPEYVTALKKFQGS